MPASFRREPAKEANRVVIANDEIPSHSQDLYFWEAPKDYLGQNLYSYGNSLKYIISYVVVRGDTSGVYTDQPDVILEGGPDNIRIGYKWRKHKNADIMDEDELNRTIIMPLREQEWFRVDDEGIPIENSQPSREDFTLLLHDIRRLLVRAKFHTDQVEGGLYQVDMEKASNSSKSIKKAIGTEECDCPPGYAGLSCEYCQPGYRRVNNVLVNGICEKCDCNNHAESCDAYTGACSECLHNTTGSNCGECKPGFYGDATRGTPNDCKRCECPLPIASNNFSPTCRADPNARYGYVCLECPEGYTGERCEICANGYYGNPSIPGGFCAPCDCGPNANTTAEGYCDHFTGQCRYCLGNTDGWKCELCKKDHWGNPAAGDCRPCDCDPIGSNSTQCDMATGQCFCKPNFTGPKCDRCAPGYGNYELECPPCDCNMTGSIDNICDPSTGQCPCKTGVFGLHCDKCLQGHFGFDQQGCEWCNCNKLGSEGPDCNEITGQCLCKPFVTGRDCSHCEPGYWNIESGKGCELCRCHPFGAYSNVCDESTGQCKCRPGVGGLNCDQCLPGHYGFSPEGCKQCEPCTAPGHICDEKTGRCVCPPNTGGPTCNDCAPGTWGHNIQTGCKPCNCSVVGSVSSECNHKTGECVCLEGFEGQFCDKCKFGYYRFPNCRKCDCHEPGTQPGSCRGDGLCQCDESGQCPCKTNVSGRRCDLCKEGTFALAADNPLGCVACFCFGKTGRCEQSTMVWVEKTYPQREASFVIGTSDIKIVHQMFKVIPTAESGTSVSSDISVGVRNFGELRTPFYWSVPGELLNDQVASYNGYLRFRIYSRGGGGVKMSADQLKRWPLVVLQGNHRLVLYHYGPATPSPTGLYQVRLHEAEWTQASNPDYPVTRDILMVALQKVQHILIRSSDSAEATYVRLSDLSLEVAKAGGFSSRLAIGVEQCRCPTQYTEASCQDPNVGYYRKRKPNYLDSKDILDLVGWAEPCNCFNYSRICNKETGECVNCEGFTTGPHCNLCLRGYYGDPTRGIPCRKCACPTLANSFSETCELIAGSNSEYVCTDCAPGYAGRHCEVCADGYWGNPMAPGGKCVPCSCSPIGSIDNICDKLTGQCRCKEGITGHDCSNCPPRHVLTNTTCINCDDDCTGLLLDDVEFLQSIVNEANLTDVANLPWTRLLYQTKNLNRIKSNLDRFRNRVQGSKDMIGNFTLNFDLETLADLLLLKARELSRKAPDEAGKAAAMVDKAQNVKDLIADLWQKIRNIIDQLKRHGMEGGDPFGTALDQMYEDAMKVLLELKSRDFTLHDRKGQRELELARALLERVRALVKGRGETGPIKDRLKKLMALLTEIYEMINHKIFPETREADKINKSLRPTLDFIVRAISNATSTADMANATLVEARSILEAVRGELYDTKLKYAALPGLVDQMMNLTDTIEKQRSILARLNPEYEEKYVRPCMEHADALARRVEELARLFNQTRDVAEFPLQAAKVYEKIVSAIEEAERAVASAKEAAEKAYKEAYPDGGSLRDRAKESLQVSQKLLEEADELARRLDQLRRELMDKNRLIAEIERMVELATRELEAIKAGLGQLPDDLAGELLSITGRLQQLIGTLERTHGKLDGIFDHIAALLPQLETLKTGTTAGLETPKQDIERSLLLIKEAREYIDGVESKVKGVDRLRNQLELNLRELKMKILFARQKAASIRVSLGADKEETCIRSYEPDIEPSFTNNIVLYYSIKHEHKRNALLLFLGNSNRSVDDFMALEMYNRRIRFIWNTGNAPRSIENPMVIQTNDGQLSKDSHWYRIEVKRFGNHANLSVLRVPDARRDDPYETTDTAETGSKRMDLDRQSYFTIGGLPPELESNNLLTRHIQSRSYAGCMYELSLDGKRVGLWNFTTNIGCDGCKEGATEQYESDLYNFYEEYSYAKARQFSGYQRETYTVSFHFRTFDEDALLFFTSNRHTKDYVAIYIRDGLVHYEVHFGSDANPTRSGVLLQLKSKTRVNTGDWVKLEGSRDGKTAVLKVNEVQQEANLDRSAIMSTALALDYADCYWGGVTPNFSKPEFVGTRVPFKSFVGCLKVPQIDTTTVNLQKVPSYGVVPGCMEKPIRVLSFKGDGFLELDGRTLSEEKVEMSLTFKTTKKSGILLLSTFENKNRMKEEVSHLQTCRNRMTNKLFLSPPAILLHLHQQRATRHTLQRRLGRDVLRV